MFLFHFANFLILFATNIFLDKQFLGSLSIRFDFFASFRLFPVRFRFRFLLFRFDAKQAKSGIFPISIFASEAKMRAHPTPNAIYVIRFRSYVDRRCKCALLESINMYYDLKIIHFERGLKESRLVFAYFLSFSILIVRRPFSFCVKSSAGILEQSMRARKRVGIGFLYRPARLQSLAELIPGHLKSLKIPSLFSCFD
jgi:hypothetical protein